MPQPYFSIITVNLNNAQGLQKTIESVVAQSCKDFEYIVIDGNSKDGSRNIIENYDTDIAYWVSENDNGIFNAMNKGIERAVGKYCIFLNSGDFFVDNRVLASVKGASSNEDILFGNLQNEGGVVHYPDHPDFIFFITESIGHPATFIKRNLFVDIGNYNEENKICSDWEFFIKAFCIKNVTYKHLPFVVSYFCPGGISSDKRWLNVQMAERSKVISVMLGNHFPQLYNYISDSKRKLRLYEHSSLNKMLNIFRSTILFKALSKWR